jgi:hypothetical protein
LHASRREKFGSKDSKKISLPNPVPAASRTCLSLSLHHGVQPPTSISITSNRPNTSYSESAAVPLSSATFLLPSPAIDTGHHSFHRSPLSHQQSLLVATKLPSQVNLLPLPFLLLLLLLLLFPRWSPLFIFSKKKILIPKIFSKKIGVFLVYFSIYFV